MLNIFLWIILSLCAGAAGSFFTYPAIPTWYAGLAKPLYNPPNWIFGPVWTTLYILMGSAMGLVANTKIKNKKIKNRAQKSSSSSAEKKSLSFRFSSFTHTLKSAHGHQIKAQAYQLFAAQLALNSLWSFIFFGLKLPLLAFIEILVLLGVIVLTTRLFLKIKKTAGYLLFPYIAWVTYASILNISIILLN